MSVDRDDRLASGQKRLRGRVNVLELCVLLWDVVRCLLRETGRTAEQYAVRGWRQWRHLSREVKKLFNKVRSTRRAQRHPERVETYLARCRALVERAEPQ